MVSNGDPAAKMVSNGGPAAKLLSNGGPAATMVSNGGPAPVIPQFYAGRSVFITGASGFMGQVLVERLLTTCPEVSRLHLLLRRKKEEDADDRLRRMKESPVFDNIRQCYPSQLDKIHAVPGDITEPKLGLDDATIEQLKDVSVVFHSAATLKFQEELGQAVQQNVRSVMRVLELCDTMPNLQAFVHVSTGYSNAERLAVEERVYEPPAPLAAVLALTDNVPPPILAQVTDKLIHPKPNTYTYTKALGEVAVQEHHGHFPKAIFRPTIVVSSLRHPHPGWIQNLNGPSGFIASAGKGLMHVMRVDSEVKTDLLPVDIAIDTLIAVAWETAIDKPPSVRVYNCSTQENPITFGAFERRARRHVMQCPFDNTLWYPSGFVVANRFVYKIVEFLLTTLPLYLADYFLALIGTKNKLSFITINSRLKGMNDVLSFFTLHEFDFETKNVQKLRQRMTPQDAAIFNLDPGSIDWDEHNLNFVRGVKKYIFKEKDEDIPKAKQHMRKMYVLHLFVLALMFFLLFRCALSITPVHDAVFGLGRMVVAFFT